MATEMKLHGDALAMQDSERQMGLDSARRQQVLAQRHRLVA